MGFGLDQHMMVDRGLIRKIVSAAGIKHDETVLEIGAGSGNLTIELAKKAGKVIAIEADERFRDDLESIGNADIVFGNALEIIDKLNIDNLKFDKIVSNLPYSICEPLMQRLPFCSFSLAVLTVPKGFAYRVLMGRTRLGLVMRELFEISVLFDVPKDAFEPRPGTGSVAISVRPKKEKSLLSAMLLHPGMKVKNAIMRALFERQKMTKNQARKAIKSLKLNNKLLEKTVRDVGLEDFAALKKAL
jgi:16S rRNA A1518/A1519 N6-dimethyltransferase RsmA/KsgA/DIM1 with predicted DNA glycosylase/AP lyase activity